MDSLIQDVRYGLHNLLKHKTFSAIAVATLALGIGVNAVMFSAFNAVMLKPLPYREPGRIVMVWDTFQRVGASKFGVAYANFADVKARTSDVFESLAIFQAQSNSTFNLTGVATPQRLQGARVTGGFFESLGVSPLLGRLLNADDEVTGRNRVVVVSYDFWRNSLGSDPKATERTLELNGTPYRVVGVMPAGFAFPSSQEMPPGQRFGVPNDLWAPLTVAANSPTATDRIHHSFRVVGRLKPGVTVQRAQQRANTVFQQITSEHPTDNAGLGVSVMTLKENQVAAVRPVLVALLAAVGLVLLIACTNVANLVLSRATMRQKEFAIRASLGATHRRLLQQLLTESVLLATVGGLAGLAAAAAATRSLAALVPADIPRMAEVTLDWRVLLFTAGISLLTGILFGLVPALQASRPNLFDVVKTEGRSSTGTLAQKRLRNALVGAEIALVFVLLMGAGLMLRSFEHLQSAPAGFDPNQVMTGRVTLPGAYPVDRKLQFYRDLTARLSELPSVRSAAVVRDLPLGGTDPRYGVTVAGRPDAEQPDGYTVRVRIVSPRYFETMGVAVKQGRAIDARDGHAGAPVAMLNENAARAIFPNQPVIGRTLISFGGFAQERLEVVGVASDVKFGGLDTEADGEIYVPFDQLPDSFVQPGIGSMAMVLKTQGDPLALATPLRNVVSAIDPNVPVSALVTMDSMVATSLAPRRFNLMLLAIFGGASLMLAAVGIYGVLSYWVSQRTREIGTRMALGAEARQVMTLVLSEAMRVVLYGLAIGAVIGLVVARLVARVMPTALVGVSINDPLTTIVAGLVLVATAAVACAVPARRAVSIDPTTALRPD